jgi:hypothetical protein
MNTTQQETKLVVINGQVIEQPAKFTAQIGTDIGFEKGARMIKRHMDANPDDVMAQFMGREIIEKILAQPGTVGIRTFYGLNELGIKQLVFVGVDQNGHNILEYNEMIDGELKKRKAIVADRATICPPSCGTGNGDDQESSIGWNS